LLERAARISDKRKFDAARTAWFNSEQGKQEATQEFRRLIAEFKQITEELTKDNPDFQFIHEYGGDDNHVFYCLGISLVATWNSGRIVNNLEGSRVYFKLFKGRISYQNILRMEEPSELTQIRYNIDMHQNNGIVWRKIDGERKDFPTTSKLADLWMRMMLAAIENHGEHSSLR
jgi:hypothetical protein